MSVTVERLQVPDEPIIGRPSHGTIFTATTCLAVALTSVSLPALNEYAPTFIPNTSEESPAIQLNEMKRQILLFTLRSYRNVESNWDGYGGQATDDKTADDALVFLRSLPLYAALPYSGLTGDGEIDLIWDQDNTFIDITFSGDKTYSFYARDSQGTEQFGDNIPLSNPIPSELINIIKSIKL